MTRNNKPTGDLASLSAASPESNDTLVHVLVICTHIVLLLLLYAQTRSFDYVHFDDVDYIVKNSAVRSGLSLDGVRWAFTSFYASNWHPLTWLSHMADVSLFGIDPGWAHIHNMVLHGLNGLLVYALFLRFSGNWRKAFLLSLVFLVHPLHVESVAWIAERKDLLCAFYFLLGLIFYDSYRNHPGPLRYAGVVLAFAMALLAKPMAVTFPVVLLILDLFMYRERFTTETTESAHAKNLYLRAAVEKLPLFAMSALVGIVTIAAQDGSSAIAYLDAHSVSARWFTATSAYLIYLKQFFFPMELVAFYPISAPTSFIDFIAPSIILLALLVTVVIFSARLPLLALGLCWYLATLLPVIGLMQVGSQAHADRYMYLPSLGILIPFLYLLPSRDSKNYRFANVLWTLFVVYLSMICFFQVSYWKNRNMLFSRTLEVIGPNYKSHIHLAQDYKNRGMLKEAREQGMAALKLQRNRPDAYQALGGIALAEENFKEAEKYYRLALTAGPLSLNAERFKSTLLNNIGIAMAEQGKTAEAIETFEQALAIDPTLIESKQNLDLYGKPEKQRAAQ